ncbi:AGAP000452-PA-like protein [Anopheles sinensis]|uniref:AGAP000452-PA-like protein n=1 Tax=Anopheles sinensis TaxID=74873 RepID=A0A084VLR5_ANOSI|nr:AGAP000452-PA-like protein [Anopheles sinensis]
MYCSNENKPPNQGALGDTQSAAAMRPFHPHGLYADKDPELHFWEGSHGTNQNTTPVSTVLHSPEPTALDSEPKMRFQKRHQIQVGRSPVGSGGHNESSDSTTASSPVLLHAMASYGFEQCHHPSNSIAVGAGGGGSLLPVAPPYSTQSILSDGEIVVFDDIEANWPSAGGNGPEMSIYINSAAQMAQGKESSTERCSKAQTVIGGLTIAEYEGSPRRFGTTASHSAYSAPDGMISFSKSGSGNLPRPGFPKRVSSSSLDRDAQEDEKPTLIELDKCSDEFKFYDKPSISCNESERNAYDLDTKYYYRQQTAVDGEDFSTGPGNRRKSQHSTTLSPEADSGRATCGVDFGATPSYSTKDYGSRGKYGNAKPIGKEILSEPCVEYEQMCNSMPILEDGLSSGHTSDSEGNAIAGVGNGSSSNVYEPQKADDLLTGIGNALSQDSRYQHHQQHYHQTQTASVMNGYNSECLASNIQEALNDIKSTLQNTKILPTHGRQDLHHGEELGKSEDASPVWVLRSTEREPENDSAMGPDGGGPVRPGSTIEADEETDTDLETDRLLGHQQNIGEINYFENHVNIHVVSPCSSTLAKMKRYHTAIRADNETYSPSDVQLESLPEIDSKGRHKTREGLLDPAVLIEGVLFRARYLGSTQLVCEGQPTKSTRMMQAEEAVSRIKAPAGESQPSTEVDLFISTEKIMVLNTDLKEIMMDHALRTISYIADIGQLVVLMARRRFAGSSGGGNTGAAGGGDGGAATSSGAPDAAAEPGAESPGRKRTSSSSGEVGAKVGANRTPKMICHVFESEEAQFIAQSIGQAFQVAYMEFLKANGIEDHSFMKEMDYQEKELQKEVVVPKAKGEILGVVIVESGWGSMLPTVVIANLASSGAAARCGQLNIGDQIIAINGLSLVGLPLSTCQGYIKNTKNQTVVKFTVVPCAPVVEVKIKRPNTKYQLGFSVQNGVICSLLRGGIAERGGVRVGHRIIEINNQSVVAVPHEKIVNLLATSIGEILMKTMPTSMFRLLTGQENPVYI